MPKVLCVVSLVISAIVFLLFALDLFSSIPFGGAGGLLGHLGMMFGAVVVGVFSVITIPECR